MVEAGQGVSGSPASPGSHSERGLKAKSLEALDFPAVRARVADMASFPMARELASRMGPSYSAGETRGLLAETAEGIAFLERAPDVDFSDPGDPLPLVQRASLEGVLTGTELSSVAAFLEVLARARSAFREAGGVAPGLAAMAGGISDLTEIVRRITGSIGVRGEVVDGASPVLGEIRRRSRRAYSHVSEALSAVIHSALGREVLQDDVVSVRGGRLTLQVKAEMRGRIPGVVHDFSNSGATLFVEPLTTVDLCNSWRELQLEEEEEVARILRELSALVGDVEPDIVRGADLTARIDFIMARARYSVSIGGAGALPPDDPESGQPAVRLLRARHPLLAGEAVPIDVRVGPERPVLVITGPNMGGKTVAMKTLGLAALMQQSGIMAPVGEESSLPVFDGVFADVGDEQSVQESVSTFGARIQNVVGILGEVTGRSLVLLDEIGASTDPEEGSALAKAILGRLAAMGVTTVATTHHRTVAVYAAGNPGMMNASVDLDPATLAPTYNLTAGVPGRSYAMSVAARLGLPPEILSEARGLMEPQYLSFEDWLGELHREREQLKHRLDEASRARDDAQGAKTRLDDELRELLLRREDIVHSLSREISARFDDVRRKLRRVESSLSWDAPAGSTSEAVVELEEIREEIRKVEETVPTPPPQQEDRPLTVGDRIVVRGLNVEGVITSAPDHSGQVEVAAGDLRLRLDTHRIGPAMEPVESEEPAGGVSYELGPLLPASELHVRGMRAQEALDKVEGFLDQALRDGLSSVRIVHGRGTGALRMAVRELLERHATVRSFGPGDEKSGGDGVTVVELA